MKLQTSFSISRWEPPCYTVRQNQSQTSELQGNAAAAMDSHKQAASMPPNQINLIITGFWTPAYPGSCREPQSISSLVHTQTLLWKDLFLLHYQGWTICKTKAQHKSLWGRIQPFLLLALLLLNQKWVKAVGKKKKKRKIKPKSTEEGVYKCRTCLTAFSLLSSIWKEDWKNNLLFQFLSIYSHWSPRHSK